MISTISRLPSACMLRMTARSVLVAGATSSTLAPQSGHVHGVGVGEDHGISAVRSLGWVHGSFVIGGRLQSFTVRDFGRDGKRHARVALAMFMATTGAGRGVDHQDRLALASL